MMSERWFGATAVLFHSHYARTARTDRKVLSLLVVTLLPISSAIVDDPLHGQHQLREASHDLGIHQVQLFAKAPILDKERHVVLNIWLKRVVPPDNATAHAIHGFAWAEDVEFLERQQEGHLLMGIDQNVWQPRLRLETQRGAVLHSASVMGSVQTPQQAFSSLRPFHFSFHLDPKYPGRCFKIYEETFPGIRAGFCLPLSPQRLCRRLAAPVEMAAAVQRQRGVAVPPALWSLVFPVRTQGVNGTHWEYTLRLAANRVYNHALYHVGMGGAGLLVYVDRLTRIGLERLPRIQHMVARGHLLFVGWEMPERRPMAYKYDQALVASHALLGLSSCGPSVMLLLADMDEYLYSPAGNGWPAIHDCLASAGSRAVLHRVQRIQILSSRLDPAKEGAWWVLPARSLSRHPILAYDRLGKAAVRSEQCKVIAAPAGRIVGFYIHDGFPLNGTSHLASAKCAFFLHVPNYWGGQARTGSGAAGGGGTAASSEFTPFKLVPPWVPEGAAAAAALETGSGGAGRAGAGGRRGVGAGVGAGASAGVQAQRKDVDPLGWMVGAKVRPEDLRQQEAAKQQ